MEQAVVWMRTACEFDPLAVEVAFGGTGAPLPAWELALDPQHVIALHGKIDRIDIHRDANTGDVWCLVVDYKSSPTILQDRLVTHGLQLQLPAYLAALTHLAPGRLNVNARGWMPAGMFYAPLRGAESTASNRAKAAAEAAEKRREAHRHRGCFRADALPKLDNLHDQNQPSGQFQSSRRGQSPRSYKDMLSPEEFLRKLDAVENTIRTFGRRILAGDVRVDPCALTSSKLACDQCGYAAICRINPWTHVYRRLSGRHPPNSAQGGVATGASSVADGGLEPV